jgi:hypothetical protein
MKKGDSSLQFRMTGKKEDHGFKKILTSTRDLWELSSDEKTSRITEDK